MMVLGIETSCDETAAAVVEDGRQVRSSVVWSQVQAHAPYRGVVPEIASRNHLKALIPVVETALHDAGVAPDRVDGLAVTLGPGLIGSLLVGVQFAKAVSFAWNRPLVGVNHLEAHVMAAFLDKDPPDFPFVALAVSGGHTSLYRVDAIGAFRLLGRTRDDAAGEAFDKAAALLGLPYPGGVHVDRASEGRNPEAVHFPRAMLREADTLDVSFSGLKTALRRHIESLQAPLDAATVGDLAASFQEAVVDVLVTRTLHAATQEQVRHVVVAGGVAANRRLRARMTAAITAAGLRLHLVPMAYCTDNAAMVAALGYHYLFGDRAGSRECARDLDMDPFERHVLDGW